MPSVGHEVVHLSESAEGVSGLVERRGEGRVVAWGGMGRGQWRERERQRKGGRERGRSKAEAEAERRWVSLLCVLSLT